MPNSKTKHVLHVFPSFEIGGSQRRFVQLVKEHGIKYTHSIVSINGKWDAWSLISDQPNCKKQITNLDQVNAITGLFRARRILSEIQPDLLVTYNWGSIEWAAANLRPLCPHIHIEDGFRPDEVKTRKPRRNLFRRMVLRDNTRLVVISETLKRIALDEWQIPSERVLFIPNGVNIEKFSVPKSRVSREDLGLKPADVVIGTVAALRPEKDLQSLIKAVADLQDFQNIKLVIGGDGPEFSHLQQLVQDCGLDHKVVLYGYTENPETLYPVFDILALSSRTEQMPLSVLEAMAAKLPVAAYDVGDVMSMVSEENKPFIVERTDKSLSRAIKALANDPNMRKRLGASNYEKARSVYSEETMFKAYDRLFTH